MKRLSAELKGFSVKLATIVEEWEQIASYKYYVMDEIHRAEDIKNILEVDLDLSTGEPYNNIGYLSDLVKTILQSSMFDIETLEECYVGLELLELKSDRNFLEMILNYLNQN